MDDDDLDNKFLGQAELFMTGGNGAVGAGRVPPVSATATTWPTSSPRSSWANLLPDRLLASAVGALRWGAVTQAKPRTCEKGANAWKSARLRR
jgi:hypothetical protein